MNLNANTELPAEQATLVALPADMIGEDPEMLRQLLLDALIQNRRVVLDASQVARVGTACLQLVLAFLREATLKQLAVEIRSPSTALADALLCTGLGQDSHFCTVGVSTTLS